MVQTRFMRWAAVVGDLGSPFYLEERQRDVWNEASAVGFQLMIWLSLAGSTLSLWIGGRPALPYALVMAAVSAVGSVVTIRYARLLGVEPVQPGAHRWVSFRRVAVAGALYLLFLGGLVRAVWSLGTDSVRHGFLIGLPLGLVVMVVGVVLGVRARRAADRAADAGQPGDVPS